MICIFHQIFRAIKSRIIRWARNIARIGESILVYTVLMGKPEGKRPHERPRLDGRITLRWVFRKWYAGTWTGSSWLEIRTGGGHV